MKKVKISLGCGQMFSDDLIGFDIYDYGQQYKGFNMEKDRLPFEDDSVDYIVAYHSLEHLWDVKHIMNEAWRVLKINGEFEIKVPNGLWAGASNPTHRQIITACWFDFFRREKTKIYGYKRWKIKKLEERNEGSEIFCVMSPNKE